MSVTLQDKNRFPRRVLSHPLETVATFTARRISLLITVLILHVPQRFDNRLLVTESRVPAAVTNGEKYY
jgi:hypothetical protein